MSQRHLSNAEEEEETPKKAGGYDSPSAITSPARSRLAMPRSILNEGGARPANSSKLPYEDFKDEAEESDSDPDLFNTTLEDLKLYYEFRESEKRAANPSYLPDHQPNQMCFSPRSLMFLSQYFVEKRLYQQGAQPKAKKSKKVIRAPPSSSSSARRLSSPAPTPKRSLIENVRYLWKKFKGKDSGKTVEAPTSSRPRSRSQSPAFSDSPSAPLLRADRSYGAEDVRTSSPLPSTPKLPNQKAVHGQSKTPKSLIQKITESPEFKEAVQKAVEDKAHVYGPTILNFDEPFEAPDSSHMQVSTPPPSTPKLPSQKAVYGESKTPKGLFENCEITGDVILHM